MKTDKAPSGRGPRGGWHKTKVYGTWYKMLKRCTRPGDKDFKKYGAKGITVCERWKEFKNFLADMGEPPSPAHGLDRKDGSKGYSPGNCRWATIFEQNQNRPGFVRQFTINGETRIAVEWCRKLGLSYRAFKGRIRRGWTVEQALELADPPEKRTSWIKTTGVRELARSPASEVRTFTKPLYTSSGKRLGANQKWEKP